MQFLSDIYIKGKPFFENISEANGSSIEFLVVKEDAEGEGEEADGEVLRKKITIPSSAGIEDVVNTSDGSGGFKETLLKVEGDKIKNKYGDEDYPSEISIYDDGLLDIAANDIGIRAEHAHLQRFPSGEYIPERPSSLVTKKYVDEKLVGQWVVHNAINITESVTIAVPVTKAEQGYTCKFGIQCKAVDGNDRFVVEIEGVAVIYDVRIGDNREAFTSGVDITSFSGALIPHQFAPNCAPIRKANIDDITVSIVKGSKFGLNVNVKNNVMDNMLIRTNIEMVEYKTTK